MRTWTEGMPLPNPAAGGPMEAGAADALIRAHRAEAKAELLMLVAMTFREAIAGSRVQPHGERVLMAGLADMFHRNAEAAEAKKVEALREAGLIS